jgi:hypothetical protein
MLLLIQYVYHTVLCTYCTGYGIQKVHFYSTVWVLTQGNLLTDEYRSETLLTRKNADQIPGTNNESSWIRPSHL